VRGDGELSELNRKNKVMGAYHNTAIVFGDLKEALLHFEYVVPMNISGICVGLRPKISDSGHAVERFKEISMDGYRELKASFDMPEDISSRVIVNGKRAACPALKRFFSRLSTFLMLSALGRFSGIGPPRS
jgi:hypothetical protein